MRPVTSHSDYQAVPSASDSGNDAIANVIIVGEPQQLDSPNVSTSGHQSVVTVDGVLIDNTDPESIIDSNIDPPISRSELYDLCYDVCVYGAGGDDDDDVYKPEIADEKWEAIRSWLRHHPHATERAEATNQLGRGLESSLHLVCRARNPPMDVIIAMMECSPDLLKWADKRKWIPLHYACSSGTSSHVIELLINSYPEGRTCVDTRGRTPLHMAVFGGSSKISGSLHHPEDDFTNVIRVLCAAEGSKASSKSDENGWLPLHYACAFGVSTKVLQIIFDAHPDGITTMNDQGQTVLHLAMVNASKPNSPEIVEFLLRRIQDALGKSSDEWYEFVSHVTINGQHTALSLLVFQADNNTITEKNAEWRRIIMECLQVYLAHDPPTNSSFFTSLQSLPDWLRYPTVINQNVKRFLNEAVAKPMTTFVYILDFYMLCTILTFFSISANDYLFHAALTTQQQEEDNQPYNLKNHWFLIPVYVGVGYFFLREVLQVVSIVSVSFDKISAWFADFTNWADVAVITMVLVFTSAMQTAGTKYQFMDDGALRTGVAFTILTLLISFMTFLKSIRVEFAVFFDGVVFVWKRLGIFLGVVLISILHYAVAFVFIYQGGEKCRKEGVVITPDDNESCQGSNPDDCDFFAHCKFSYSFLRVYAMFMGEVNQDDYMDRPFSKVIYVSFVAYAVILLSNILIAVVTDSYAVIKNERAEMVFWDNRLDFVAEMIALSELSFIKRIKRQSPDGSSSSSSNGRDVSTIRNSIIVANRDNNNNHEPLRQMWDNIMTAFDKDESNNNTIGRFCRKSCSVILAIVVIPLWLTMGFATMGLLLPAQIREKLLFQRTEASDSSSSNHDRISQDILQLRNGLKKLSESIEHKMKTDDIELEHRINEAITLERKVMSDMRQVKEIMNTILNLTRGTMGDGR